MHLIVCVDDRDGVSFCGRRLSQDRLLIAHLLRLTRDSKLWMSGYSAKLFPNADVLIDQDFLHKAGEGDYCFLETAPFPSNCENLESVILYHWNRAYPSTVRFPRNLLESMHLQSAEEFAGSSHEKITMERFVP